MYKGTVSQQYRKELSKITSQSIAFKAETDASAAHTLANHLMSDNSPCAQFNLGGSPAMSAIAQPTPSEMSPRERRRHDDEKEKTKKREENKKQAQEAKAKYWASPAGLSQKWLGAAARNMKILNSTKARLITVDLSAGLKKEWQKVMKLHCDELVELRARMEGVYCESEKPAPDLFDRAKNAVDDFKKDNHDLNALLSSREKRRQPRVAAWPILERAA